MHLDTVIRGGSVKPADDTYRADVGIAGGKIAVLRRARPRSSISPSMTLGARSDRESTRGRFVELVSTRPAKTFGLYPGKGSITVGADADVVLWDAKRKWTISASSIG